AFQCSASARTTSTFSCDIALQYLAGGNRTHLSAVANGSVVGSGGPAFVDQLDVQLERLDLLFEVQDPLEGLIEPAAQLVHGLRRTVDAHDRAVFHGDCPHDETLSPASVGFFSPRMASARANSRAHCRIPMRCCFVALISRRLC